VSLQIYNTLSRKLEEFKPLNPPQVKMYCCGPTVYDFLHVGNFRGAVFYNLLRNHLENSGFQVNYVYNFTDIDDKILKRAAEENTTPNEIAEKYIGEFRKDFDALKLRPHSINPRVTESLDSIIEVIQDLISNGKAYAAEGEVFYSISDFKDYGKLSHRKPDELLEGTRKEVDTKKKNALDFTLWKPAKEGEQAFDSPWGPGRPGWHIECTAMIKKHLGNSIDIHGGGLDLLFPHHENEIAQSEGCSHGDQYVKYWVHNNMFTFSGAKMSKSVGNIRTMRSFLENYPPEIFKFIVLGSHYRSEAEFSDSAIQKAMEGLSRIYSALAIAKKNAEQDSVDAKLEDQAQNFEQFIEDKKREIGKHLDNDFATPKVFSVLFEVVRQFNTVASANKKLSPPIKEISLILIEFFEGLSETFALFQTKDFQGFLNELDQVLLTKMKLDSSKIEELIEKRSAAKAAKEYQEADKFRDELLAMMISIKDSPEGTTWEVNKTEFFKTLN
jgi:cysteinyl-tRNA synthetase